MSQEIRRWVNTVLFALLVLSAWRAGDMLLSIAVETGGVAAAVNGVAAELN